MRFGGLSQIHTIIEIHHQGGFGKGLEEKMFLTNGFPFKNFYTIFDLFTEPYQWMRHYAVLAKKTRGVNRFLSLCRATSLEVKLYF